MKPRPGAAVLLPLFFCSGAAALGQQVVWVRMLSAGLGHEVPAMVAVTAAVLGGMAAGAAWLSSRIGRTARPARWYGGLEWIIGAWAAGSAFFIPTLNDWALRWMGPEPSPIVQWGVVFLLPFVGLLPATAAMGATFPAMERSWARRSGDGECVARVYAANTAGAVIGIFASAFALMPALGFRQSLLALAGVSCACGVGALLLGGNADAEPVKVAAADAKQTVSARLYLTLFLTGLFGIGFQLVGVRILSQVLENTLYTFAAALAVYLVGTAVGAAWASRHLASGRFGTLTTSLLGAAGLSCLVGAHSVRFLHRLYDALRNLTGDGSFAVALSEVTVAACVFLLPTMAMGALFSHLAQEAARVRGALGKAAAWNTLGCALAAIVVGLGLLPAAGVKGSVITLALGYFCLMPSLSRPMGMAVVGAGLIATLPGSLRQVELAPGASVLEYREGVMAGVAVVRTPDGHRSLRVNNRLQMGGTAAALAERRQAHLPLLLHPDPKRALFLGPGTGITLGAATAYPGLASDGVELVPEVLEVMSAFEPENRGVRSNAQVRLHAADARRFVRTTTQRYDVIVADLFHPGQDGAGFLYTREHYEAIRRCLNPGGLFCQWLPLHQLSEASLRSVTRTFLASFPQAQAWLLQFNVDIPVLGLVGMEQTRPWPADWLERRLAVREVADAVRQSGLDKPLQVLGCLTADADGLRQFAANAPVGTDDDPIVLFEAGRFSPRRDVRPHEMLMSYLGQVKVDGKRFVAEVFGSGQEALGDNLAAFLAARDLYLRGLVEEGAGRLSPAIDRYLESTRTSLYFTASYARLVTIIQVLAATDRTQARQLFDRLEAAQPAQPLGKKLLAPLLE